MPNAAAKTFQPPRTLSVVIPTFNEAHALPSTIEHVRRNAEVIEIIVVDGGSRDDTRRIASETGCTLMESGPGRGIQMRAGAAKARGDAILLLHADTWLPAGAAKAALEALSDPAVAAGGFWKVFREPPLLLRGSRFKCAFRLWLGRRVAGDQGLFLRRETLEEIGGVPAVPLMEEFELCARLRKLGRIVLADAVVETSARRFVERGVLRTYARMWHVVLRYWMGATPWELSRLYEKK